MLEAAPEDRKVAELHRLHDAIHNHGGPQTGPQAKEQQLSAFIATQSLHRRIIDQFHGVPECGFEVETNPPMPQIVRLRDGPIPKNRSRIAGSKPADSSSLGQSPGFGLPSAVESSPVRSRSGEVVFGRWREPSR